MKPNPIRSMKVYVQAATAYMRDCNVRLHVRRNDKRRRKLKLNNDKAFKAMLRAYRNTFGKIESVKAAAE